MKKILTAILKELLLLKRDRTGLLILFLMPALLVMVITLVQENVMELTGQKKTRMLFLDQDQGELGRALRQQLSAGNIEVLLWDEQQKTSGDIQAAVSDGKYQVGVVIPEGSSVRLREQTARLFQQHDPPGSTDPPALIPVHVFFDPGILPGFRSGLSAQLEMALAMLAMEAKARGLGRVLEDTLDGLGVPAGFAPLPTAEIPELLARPLFGLRDSYDSSEISEISGEITEMPPYNPVQQNVPAWAVFGMFFTAVPIAGSILQERKSGIWIRLTSLPVSHLQLFCGKIAAYMGVCSCQFLLIALVGFYLFPYLGLPAFTVPQNCSAVLLTVLVTSLAVCGYGIFLGMACTTYEQASTLGSTVVVALAAIGGVMVPVYAMPQVMQRLSIISPLNWGLTAFYDLLMRGSSFSVIKDDLTRLIVFFIVTVLFAWQLARRRM